MQRVISIAVVLSMMVFAWNAEAKPSAKVDGESAVKVKRVRMIFIRPIKLVYSPYQMTKVLLKLAVNPRAKMLSAALEGMTAPLTDGSDQRAARPQGPRVIALAPVKPAQPPLPTRFQAP